jgi:hypothetical protein
MKFVLALALLLTASSAHADPRPPGGHRITSQAIPSGTCRKQLVYLNKFSSAYQTVCNRGMPSFFGN